MKVRIETIQDFVKNTFVCILQFCISQDPLEVVKFEILIFGLEWKTPQLSFENCSAELCAKSLFLLYYD